MIPESLENFSTLAFIGLDRQLDLRQRSNLIELDQQLHELWSLGKNFILGWCPTETGIELACRPSLCNRRLYDCRL